MKLLNTIKKKITFSLLFFFISFLLIIPFIFFSSNILVINKIDSNLRTNLEKINIKKEKGIILSIHEDLIKNRKNLNKDNVDYVQIMSDILKNDDVNKYNDLSMFFGWFNQKKELLKIFNFEIDNYNEKSIKSFFFSLFVIFRIIFSQLKDLRTIDKNISFNEDDITNLSDPNKTGKYIIEPLNNFLKDIEIIYKEAKDGGKPTIKLKLKKTYLKFHEIIRFIYRIIKYLIFKISFNSFDKDKLITFGSINNLFEEFYENNEKRKSFYEFLVETCFKHLKLVFHFENETDEESKKPRDLLSIVFLNNLFFLKKIDGLLSKNNVKIPDFVWYFANESLLRPWLTTIIELTLEPVVNEIKKINIFDYLKKSLFTIEVLNILSFENKFDKEELLKKYDEKKVNIIYWIKLIYDEIIKNLEKWIKDEEIDVEKQRDIKEIIEEFGIKSFFNKLRENELSNIEFKWKKLENYYFKLEPYVRDFIAEEQQKIIIKYTNKKTKQKYTIMLKELEKDNYQLIYFATNHFKHSVKKYLELNFK